MSNVTPVLRHIKDLGQHLVAMLHDFWECAILLTVMIFHGAKFGKISAQPHTTLCIQFLNREKNDKNSTLLLRKHICLTIVWGYAEILPKISP